MAERDDLTALVARLRQAQAELNEAMELFGASRVSPTEVYIELAEEAADALTALHLEVNGQDSLGSDPVTSLGLRKCLELQAENLAALRADRDRLRAALEMIAGQRQCLDNLMSDKDIARAALAASTPAGEK